MRILILWADDRSPNLGVRALGAGTRALASSVWPDAEVVNYSYGSRVAPVPMGSVKKATIELATGRGGFVEWLADFDLVIDTRAGDSFADIYGLRRLLVQNLMGEAVRRSKTPLVFGPQTIGPFKTVTGRRMGKRALSQASVVMARDSASAERSAALGRTVDHVVTDVVFALDAPEITVRRDVILNVSGLLWTTATHADPAVYQKSVVDVIRGLSDQGRRVTLMPHVLAGDPIDNDEAVLDDVIKSAGSEVDLAVPASLDDARAIVGGAQLTIGSRMHACLNSLSTGVPALPMAYSDKFKPLFADLGWPFVVDLRTNPDPAAAILQLTKEPHLREQAAASRDRAAAEVERARVVLRNMTTGRDNGVR